MVFIEHIQTVKFSLQRYCVFEQRPLTNRPEGIICTPVSERKRTFYNKFCGALRKEGRKEGRFLRIKLGRFKEIPRSSIPLLPSEVDSDLGKLRQRQCGFCSANFYWTISLAFYRWDSLSLTGGLSVTIIQSINLSQKKFFNASTGACQCLSQVCCPPILSSPVQPT